MRTLLGCCSLIVVLSSGAATPAPAQEPRATPARQQRIIVAGVRLPGSANAYANRQLICRGGAIPDGWLLVDDVRDPNACGGPNPSVVRMYNVWVIERIDDRAIGTVIDICAATRVPDGWELVDVFRAKELCGHPDDVLAVNVKRIRRVR